VIGAITRRLSPAGPRARLAVFIFHRVLERPDPMLPGEPDGEAFDRILSWIGGQFTVLHPREACERLTARALPAAAAMITFDDGYRDNHDVALPVLRRHRMSAAFFLATGFLGHGAMFNDRVREALRGYAGESLDASWLGAGVLRTATPEERRDAVERLLPRVKYLPLGERDDAVARLEEATLARERPDLMMDADQVRALAAAGMEIGGHSRRHPILRLLDRAGAAREIRDGFDDIRAITGEEPALFAYPNGRPGTDFDARQAAAVRDAGFRWAFSTQYGVAGPGTDPLAIPRLLPWDRNGWRFRARMMTAVLAARLRSE
jgi:peptidoglycan/xylan/chitin deacetylase (PgdA/CDA1 family)